MCGGAIIADLIPAVRSGRRVAASHPWTGQEGKNKRPRSGLEADDDDFETAFEEFDCDYEEEGEYDTEAMEGDDDDVEELQLPFGRKLLAPLFPQGEPISLFARLQSQSSTKIPFLA